MVLTVWPLPLWRTSHSPRRSLCQCSLYGKKHNNRRRRNGGSCVFSCPRLDAVLLSPRHHGNQPCLASVPVTGHEWRDSSQTHCGHSRERLAAYRNWAPIDKFPCDIQLQFCGRPSCVGNVFPKHKVAQNKTKIYLQSHFFCLTIQTLL